MKKFLSIITALAFVSVLTSCIWANIPDVYDPAAEDGECQIRKDSPYSSLEEVSLYIKTYEKLPSNYITKKEAEALGWKPSEGNLWDVTDKKSIGGDKFANREELLPKNPGRQYYECDINYQGGYRGKERIIYSNDGLIYYTDDHYASFTLIYGEE